MRAISSGRLRRGRLPGGALGVAVAGALLAALAFVILSSFAPDIKARDDGGAHAASRSAIGFAGLTQLLQDSGVSVLVRRNEGPVTGASLLVLTPPIGADPKAVRAAEATTVPVLIIAPKWQGLAYAPHRGWVLSGGMTLTRLAAGSFDRPEVRDFNREDGASSVTLSPGRYQKTIPADQTLTTGPILNEQSRAGDDGVTVLQDAKGHAVLVGVGAGEMFVLTDPDLMNNKGIADIATARSALEIITKLRVGDGPVVFDVTLNGLARPPNLVQMAMTPPFFAATVCALLSLCLAGWRTLVRFGPLEAKGRTIALGKRALVDNCASLIRLTRREGRMGLRYAAVTRDATARAVGAPRDLGPEQTDRYLDRLGDPSERTRPFTELVTEAARSPHDVDSLMRSARRLFQWNLEITRDRR